MKRHKIKVEIDLTEFLDNDTFHFNIRFPELRSGVASFQPVDVAVLKQAIGAAVVDVLSKDSVATGHVKGR